METHCTYWLWQTASSESCALSIHLFAFCVAQIRRPDLWEQTGTSILPTTHRARGQPLPRPQSSREQVGRWLLFFHFNHRKTISYPHGLEAALFNQPCQTFSQGLTHFQVSCISVEGEGLSVRFHSLPSPQIWSLILHKVGQWLCFYMNA